MNSTGDVSGITNETAGTESEYDNDSYVKVGKRGVMKEADNTDWTSSKAQSKQESFVDAMSMECLPRNYGYK